MRKKLSGTTFTIFSASILTLGFIFIAVLFYITNIQYQAPKIYSKYPGPVTVPPKSLRIDLERPDDNSLSFDQSIIVSGRTGPNLDVLVTSDSSDLVIKSKPDGNFSAIINLDEGVNNITVSAFDTTGDNRSVQRTVYYSKEKI